MNYTEATIAIVSVLLIILCFYFTLTFIENVHKDYERITKQSKLAAIVCLGLGLLIPIFYSIFLY